LSKQKRHSSDQKAKPAPAKTPIPAGKPLPRGAQIGIALLMLYVMTLLVFPKNVFEHYDFRFGGDNLAAAPIAKMGKDFDKEGRIPNWCPYIMGGMPMVGSLLYANPYYPGFALGNWLSFIFFGSPYAWLFLHYLLAGLGLYLLLKDLGVHWIIAALCSLFFAFNPSMVVFADVGHGSKLMTIAYLPWILLLTRRLFARPTAGRAALLTLTFGLQLLALHVQIAYYGAMLMGLYAIYSLIAEGRANLSKNVRAALLLMACGLFAFFIASPLYLQVQEYSHYSIRGGGATGGASWDYATAWSFHPLESLTYIFPSFYGFGGETYWGFMPFTDMPLYWGGVILLFAPWAVVLKRSRATSFLIILAALAWIVSFGRFLPALFWPLFELLPYFNKFRVPSLIQVLVLLPAVILAARSLQAIWERSRSKNAEREKLTQKFVWVGGLIIGVCSLLLIFQAALKPAFLSWIHAARPQIQGQAAGEAFAMFTADLIRLLLLTGVLYGSTILVLKQKWPRWALIAAVAMAAVLELNYFDRMLLHPTPPQQMQSYLQADDVVAFLKRESEPYRIFPLTSGHSPDWYMAHRIESILGYTGARPRLFQEAVDSLGYNNFSFLRMLNARYFISDKPIKHEAFEVVYTGLSEQVSRYRDALPRAFLVNRSVLLSSPGEILQLYRSGNFDFGSVAALEKPLSAPLEERASGTVTWNSRSPDHFALDVRSSGRQLLVLSEVYYPSGWRAMLDGREAPIHKVNYLFRGIEIPAGNHRVEMSFQPRNVARGNLLKWIALAVIAVSLGYSFAFRKKEASGGI